MKRLECYLKSRKMMKMSLRGMSRGVMDEMLIETCNALGVQIG